LTFAAYPNRDSSLGELHISRAMPIRERRLVGPWCFLDRYGPLAFAGEKPMNVPPHPHIGIQTVSWLLEGEVLHSDSLGSEAIVRPGGVNVMTAGSGIAHAEETPARNSGRLSGVQLWAALPGAQRNIAPSFNSVDQVPVIEARGGRIQVFAGSAGGAASPAPYFSAILGLDVQVHAGETAELELDPGFEHAALLLAGDCSLEGQPIQERTLYYLGAQRQSLTLASRAGGRLLLVGGPPFPETILMWWNFVARAPEEIAEARAAWEAARQGMSSRFGAVPGEHGPMLAAPDLVRFARPNPAS
jgi:redox-sensitive bicupin YhaK (pirin superfamily)